jgi:hypothetical protein
VNTARLILLGLIAAVPAILLIGGPVISGFVAAISAAGVAVVATSLRPGEAEFLLSVIRPLAAIAVLALLFMLFQVVPIKTSALAHPIWLSAEQALGRSISGAISIDPGATLLALGQCLVIFAIGFVAAAVALDRERAEWLLFALVTATAAVAAVVILNDVLGSSFLSSTASARSQAQACVALGIICSVAAASRTFERYETSHLRPGRSRRVLRWTFAACVTALALCAIALGLDVTSGVMFAVTYGLGMFMAVVAIRRISLGSWGCLGLLVIAAAIAIVLMATRPAGSPDATLAFASHQPQALVSTTERILADGPALGTGAGTFSFLVPIYRDEGDPVATAAPTTAAEVAVELGRPMLWAIVAVTVAGIFTLLRGALGRGRDSFYPAAGASSLLLLLLLIFCGNGVLGIPIGICIAAIIGVAFAQRQSRTVT